MTIEEFRELSLQDLQTLTGVGMSVWSQWFSGKRMSKERTLTKAAPHLGMSPGELLTAIIARRANPRRIELPSTQGKRLLRVLMDRSLFNELRLVASETKRSQNLIVEAALRSFLSDRTNLERLPR